MAAPLLAIVWLIGIFALPVIGVLLFHADWERARRLGPYGGDWPTRYDVLPQDDPPVTAPFFGCHGDTGS